MFKPAYTANQAWVSLASDIVKYGNKTAPRGLPCLEMMGYQSKVNMAYPILTLPFRKIGYRFMAAEAAWILSGSNKVDDIAPFSKDIPKFSDDGVRFFGSYGPKIVDQLAGVARALVEDPSSRQAVINIWRENPPKTKDAPCTISVQWLIRDGVLYCFDTMRSSDAYLGWPYDIFNFTMLSGYLALYLRRLGLNVRLGNITLTAGSQHLYESNLEKVKIILADDMFPETYRPFDPMDWFSEPDDLVDWLWGHAKGGGIVEGFRLATHV